MAERPRDEGASARPGAQCSSGSAEALAQLNRVYEVLRLWTNHWQPVMKLIGKDRVGAKLRKRYDVARTPYQRFRESRDLTLPRRHRLVAEHAKLAPLSLKRQLDIAVMQLERLRSRPAVHRTARRRGLVPQTPQKCVDLLALTRTGPIKLHLGIG